MITTRRTFLIGLIAAPVVITTPGLLMPVKDFILTPKMMSSEEWALIQFNKIIKKHFERGRQALGIDQRNNLLIFERQSRYASAKSEI